MKDTAFYCNFCFASIFKSCAAYGHCASKSETYYGVKGNLVISSEGIVTAVTVTPANIDERIIDNISGLLIADKGLIGEDFQQQIREYSFVNLQTLTRSNMEDSRGKDCNRWITSTRRLVETVIGQLVEQFNIEKVRAKNIWYLTTRIGIKILAHIVGVMINKMLGNPPLQFERLGLV